MCDKNNCKSRTPGTPGTKSFAQIVNNYQPLTSATKTYIPGGYRARRCTSKSNSHKKNRFNWKFARSRFVGGKFCKGQFSGIQFLIFDLKSSRDLHCLRSLGELFQALAPTKDAVSMPYLTE